MKHISSAIAGLLVLLAILTEAAGAQPVATEQGPVEGTVEGAVRVFKGIPYAAAPVGDLRWQAPAPPQSRLKI